MSAKYKASDIAAWLINRDNQEENRKERISTLKLMQLLYYCYGCFLAIDEIKLFPEEIHAWEEGAVVEEVYNIFKEVPYDKVSEHVHLLNKQPIDSYDEELLEQTYDIFGKNYTARELVDKTHRELPWLRATKYGEYLKGAAIEPEEIQDYFKKYYIKAA
ncbi:MAG: DUF4065 domain-containing protein [Lachnospiraceae bacterium]|nr:DUF4065 domain-containing protein [Lachnospiraceae bacterium]